MAKFVFRMQSYLKVKEKIEDQKKLEYGKALQKVEEEQAKKRQMEEELINNIEKLREKMEKGITPEEFIRSKQFIVQIEKNIIAQEVVIKRAKDYAESKRIELLAAVKQRKMVETLKENDYIEYLSEEAKAEQKIVDEIVSYKYGKAEE